MELPYRFAEVVIRTWLLLTGHRLRRIGSDRVPAGGAILAINHTSYIDFAIIGLSVLQTDNRLIRFMAKIELYAIVPLRWLMRGCKVIPVDRSLGHDAYRAAVTQLRAGAVVGVYPEATISRSFEIKDFKTGAARMALEAGVPIVPSIVWGSQRIATKGQPRSLGRGKYPLVVAVGPALQPEGDVAALSARLHTAMEMLLVEAREAYGDHPEGEFWVPSRMGGGAPTRAEADALDAAEKDEKERVRAEMREKRKR